jgi:PBP1b-binding outer membrane lipoprotein LpoB
MSKEENSMKKTLVFAGIAAIVLLTGCTTTTTIYDPATQQTNIRPEGNVSAEEFRIVAREAINDALTNPVFKDYLTAYKNEKNNQQAAPLMKLTAVRNETNDPDLKIGEMTDLLKQALLNARIVRVTLAEGADLQTAIAASRDIEFDPNFNQATVAKRGTLNAADIVLCPKVISSVARDGRTKAVVRTFVLEMGNVKTGEAIWIWQKQLGFTKTRPVFGY